MRICIDHFIINDAFDKYPTICDIDLGNLQYITNWFLTPNNFFMVDFDEYLINEQNTSLFEKAFFLNCYNVLFVHLDNIQTFQIWLWKDKKDTMYEIIFETNTKSVRLYHVRSTPIYCVPVHHACAWQISIATHTLYTVYINDHFANMCVFTISWQNCFLFLFSFCVQFGMTFVTKH